ncbi:MAG: cell envelope integrity EipB family protein [Pseudomonadota bacterium]|nr:cell envelope integrity EipB family protein [Pseudomonadota bacterium]
MKDTNCCLTGRGSVSFAAAILGSVVLLQGAPARAVPSGASVLAPHRAIYDMKLDETKPASGVTNYNGRLVFEVTGSPCEGYTVNMRHVVRLTDSAGQAMLMDRRSSTWEQGDGSEFRFNYSNYVDEKLSESTSGSAFRGAVPNELDIQIKKPEQSNRKLGGSMLFPTQHSLAILNGAQSGKSVVQSKVFEGFEKEERVFNTTAFIGKQTPPGADGQLDEVENGKVLSTLPSWPVTISYFDGKGGGEETPSYEIRFKMFANGVSRDLSIDYGSFAIRGSLRSLEFLKTADCK